MARGTRGRCRATCGSTGSSCRYREGAAPALAGFDLDLPAGRRIAVVGPSGAGKSTLAAVLTGAVRPDAGRVTLAGRDLSAYPPEELPRAVGGLLAEAYVFHASVRENLLLGRPDADEAELSAAMRAAGLLDWVREQPARLGHPGRRGGRSALRRTAAAARARPGTARRPAAYWCWTSHRGPRPDRRRRGARLRARRDSRRALGAADQPPAQRPGRDWTRSWSWTPAGSSSAGGTPSWSPPPAGTGTSGAPGGGRAADTWHSRPDPHRGRTRDLPDATAGSVTGWCHARLRRGGIDERLRELAARLRGRRGSRPTCSPRPGTGCGRRRGVPGERGAIHGGAAAGRGRVRLAGAGAARPGRRSWRWAPCAGCPCGCWRSPGCGWPPVT